MSRAPAHWPYSVGIFECTCCSDGDFNFKLISSKLDSSVKFKRFQLFKLASRVLPWPTYAVYIGSALAVLITSPLACKFEAGKRPADVLVLQVVF